ncbi:MAG: hypothetical protein WD877_00370 [Candidatus Saccharimonadales bacterium]
MSRGPSRANMPAPTPQIDNNSPKAAPSRRKHIDWAARTVRLELFIVLVGSALLLAAVSLYSALGSTLSSEAQRVKADKYQAVFLNGGATSGSVAYTTYFGKITSMNDRYIVLNDVYYLTTEQIQGSENVNPQLTKLGCQQLHSPFDEMVINRNQVAFWENLEDRGKVAQAIKQFKAANPNGPDCEAAQTDSTQQDTTTTDEQSPTNTQDDTTQQE